MLEVPEGVIAQNHDQAREVMARLRESTVSLQLDAFGTGYASLATLRTLPVDASKIDNSYVRRMWSDDRSRELVRIMLAMGLAFDVEVIAEGVESEREAALLAEMGCPLAQGDLFARPVPVTDLPRIPGWRHPSTTR